VKHVADEFCRRGVPFTAMWLKFGDYDAQYDTDYINETANVASSIYFVNLVIMYALTHSPHLTTQSNTSPGKSSTFSQPAPVASASSNNPPSSTKPRRYVVSHVNVVCESC
jgi:hypothetical protein